MPTITLQVGQCGNQLGTTFWDLMQQQHSHSSSILLGQEWFASIPQQQQQQTTADPSESAAGIAASRKIVQPRCVCVDSEAKVVKHWQGQQQGRGQPTVHMPGKGGGCGNNWSCGYSLAFSVSSSTGGSCAWSLGDDQNRCIDQVLEGIRHESEREAGIPDFLLLSSLAGGTGSGFGSALLESFADEYPCSTTAAAAVAPGRTGGSDTATQSLNCCLALQHLSNYAQVVLLLDNQVLLDQLNAKSSNRSSSSSSSRKGGGSLLAPSSGRGCLQGVNELAAQALVGLLWPVGEADQLARRTNIRQLASTVAADPLTKYLEVCHVAHPDAELPVNMMDNPWPARIKLLASQLPSYDPFHPTQPASTSAAFVVARGGLCSQPSKASARKPSLRLPPVQQGGTTSSRTDRIGGTAGLQYSAYPVPIQLSCWVTAGGIGSASGSNGSSGGGGWAVEAAMAAVGSSWPRWAGRSWDLQFGDCALPLWSATSGSCTSSLSAAVRRSSTGSFLRDVSTKCRQLCDAGAYMHWYQQYGTEPAEIEAAAALLADLADGYNC